MHRLPRHNETLYAVAASFQQFLSSSSGPLAEMRIGHGDAAPAFILVQSKMNPGKDCSLQPVGKQISATKRSFIVGPTHFWTAFPGRRGRGAVIGGINLDHERRLTGSAAVGAIALKRRTDDRTIQSLDPERMTTERQIAANRDNARKSSGTPEVSALNYGSRKLSSSPRRNG